MALLPLWALLVFRRAKAAIHRPKPIRSMADGVAKFLLGVFAILAGVAALSTKQLAAIVPTLFMFAILHVPVTDSWSVPNWMRYVAYVALFFVFALLIDVERRDG